MLNFVSNETDLFLDSVNKKERKIIGQFITPVDVAEFMANMYVPNKEHLNILDPGAGSGMLSAAIISRLEGTMVKSVNLTLYENNKKILPVLSKNMEYISKNSSIKIRYNIIEDDYLLSNSFTNQKNLTSNDKMYDFIISNPPYKKISKKSPEAKLMESICFGSPNKYFLFMAMSLHQLKENSEMIYIIPRSWTSGAYFIKFRQYLLEYGKIKNIHLFLSRDNVFGKEDVLQETIIIHVIKSKKSIENVLISSSNDNDFSKIEKFEVPYKLSVSKDNNQFVYLPTDKEDVDVLNKVHSFKNTLEGIGFKLKTGLVVDFRNKEFLDENSNGFNVPLFYPFHFKNNLIEFPVDNEKKQYVKKSKKSLIQNNKDYLFLKRFTSKEEKRRLQPAIYLKESFSDYDFISTENKTNFIEKISKKELTKEELYGLFVVFNSTLFDKYYRILNGSTQVNSNEINSMPVPSNEDLIKLGKLMLKQDDLSVNSCDTILEKIL